MPGEGLQRGFQIVILLRLGPGSGNVWKEAMRRGSSDRRL